MVWIFQSHKFDALKSCGKLFPITYLGNYYLNGIEGQ